MSLAAGEVHEGRIYRHENILVARETITGQIYMSFAAEVQIDCVRLEWIKDVYKRPWLLERILSTRKGFRMNI